jgi:hypothetical protein
MIYCSSRLLVCQLALLFLVETTAVPRSLAAPLNPLSPGVLKSNTTYEGAYVSTHPNLVHADAPDKEVSEFTGGKYKSCTEVKAASLCHKSAAKRGCAVTCAALDMKRVQALVQTQSSKCKAYPGKKKAYVPFIKPSEFTEADNEARYELEEKAEAEVVTESALKTAEEEIQPAEETKDAAWNLQDRLWVRNIASPPHPLLAARRPPRPPPLARTAPPPHYRLDACWTPMSILTLPSGVCMPTHAGRKD